MFGLTVGKELIPSREYAKTLIDTMTTCRVKAAGEVLANHFLATLKAESTEYQQLWNDPNAPRQSRFIDTTIQAKFDTECIIESDSVPIKPLDSDQTQALKPQHIIAIDCEMCLTAEGEVITRVSVVDRYGRVLLDTLVKPHDPITDYKTQWSGMTEVQEIIPFVQ
jgi:hypothetical protein